MTAAGSASWADTCKSLVRTAFLSILLDNISTGRREFMHWGPLVQTDQRATRQLRRHPPASCIAVLHLRPSRRDGVRSGEILRQQRARYAFVAGRRTAGCSASVFSSTCAIYGRPAQMPCVEATRPDPNNPYDASKLLVGRILSDFRPPTACAPLHRAILMLVAPIRTRRSAELPRPGSSLDPTRDDHATGSHRNAQPQTQVNWGGRASFFETPDWRESARCQ